MGEKKIYARMRCEDCGEDIVLLNFHNILPRENCYVFTSDGNRSVDGLHKCPSALAEVNRMAEAGELQLFK